MSIIAFFIVGVLLAPYYEPQISELGGLLDPVWAVAEAFDFKDPFGEDGRAVKLDRKVIEQLASNL